MTIDTFMTKRRALYKGEIGFFPSTPWAEEEVSLATNDTEVICRWYAPKTLEALRYLWGLVHKVAENTDLWRDRYDAMDYFKIRGGWSKMVWNSVKKDMEAQPKSLTRISDARLRLLTQQTTDAILTEVWPHMKRKELTREIEEMIK
jgi:hypothetical protein